MINRNDVIDTLTKCSGYATDRTPQPSQLVVAAWLEHFQGLPTATREELLDAVREYFRNPRDRLIQPSDLSGIVRAHHQDAYERRPMIENGEPPPASAEHRRRCMEEITAVLGRRWSVPSL